MGRSCRVPRLVRSLACVCLIPPWLLGCAGGSASAPSLPGSIEETAASAPASAPSTAPRTSPPAPISSPIPTPISVPPRQVSLADVGLDARAMDASTDPCVDFYQYACGGFTGRKDALAGRYSRIDELEQHTLERVRELLEQRAASDPLARVYRQCMDSAAVEQAGLTGLDDLLSAIRGSTRREHLGPVLAKLHRHGVWAGFKLGVERSPGDPSRAILVLQDAELGLPTRQHYLASGAESERLRRAYREHVQRIFRLAGASRREAEKAGKEVLRIESELARVAETSVAGRRVDGWYREVSRAHLQTTAGVLDWPAHLAALGWPEDAPIALVSDEYLSRVNALVRAHGAKGFARYLEWRLLDQLTSALPPAFLAEKLAFQATLQAREPAALPRWRVCVAAVDQAFGDLVARAYTDAHFAESERHAAGLLIDALRQALVERVSERSWLGDMAKAAARAKLQGLVMALGDDAATPPTTRADDATSSTADDTLVRATFAATILSARARAVRRQLAHDASTRPSARLFAHRVDGFYDARHNRLALSAALLAPPLFASGRPHAVNLGALATIAGHQLIHAIDDLGQAFDATGAARPAWQPADQRGYRAKARCLARAYHGGVPANNPPLTRTQDMREDIADLGGLTIAYRAFAQAHAAAGERLIADGLDETKLFFLAAAQTSCEVERDDARVPVAGRSSARVRLNRALAQMPAFADAFQCRSDAPMRAAEPDICDIW